MKKKLLSLILAGTMAASLMAGCGVSTDTGSGGSSDADRLFCVVFFRGGRGFQAGASVHV